MIAQSPQQTYVILDPSDAESDGVPLQLFLAIPDRLITAVSPHRRLPPREHFARTWWVIWARDELAAGLQIQDWINGTHRDQVELDAFAARYRAGEAREVWRLLEGYRVRGGQLIDPLVADAIDAMRARRVSRNAPAAGAVTRRQWLAEMREGIGQLPMLHSTRQFLEAMWTDMEREAIDAGELDALMDWPGTLSPEDQRLVDAMVGDILTPEIRHKVRNRGGLG